MRITKSNFALLLFGLFLLTIIISCEKAKTPDEVVKKPIPLEDKPLEQHDKLDMTSYETILDGVWNITGKPITEGLIEEFVWGESRVDDECVIFSFLKAKSPFINNKKLFLFIQSTDFSNIQNGEIKFQIVNNYHKDQGLLNSSTIQKSNSRRQGMYLLQTSSMGVHITRLLDRGVREATDRGFHAGQRLKLPWLNARPAD